MKERPFDLSTFKKVQDEMIAKSDRAWDKYNRYYYERSREYTKEEIEKIISSNDLIGQQKLSRHFFNTSGFYKRIILYYATLLKYAGLLIPNPAFGKKLSTPHIARRYNQALNYVENMNLPEILTRMATKALIDGSYYGLILNLDKDECVIMDLPSGYCTSKFQDAHGNDIIDFDVRYFYDIFDEESRRDALNTYPKVISSHFRKYSTGKVTSSWVRIPAEIGICFPFSDDGRPLFLNVIPATIDYDDAVDNEQERQLEEIRKIIVQKVPHLQDGQLLFEPEEAAEMHAGAVSMLRGNRNLSVLTTYNDVDAIISKTTADNASNTLERMLQNVYSNASVSQQVFSPVGTQALSTSITNDMSLMMIFANKASRLIGYILNSLFANSNISFKYSILAVSYYNESEFITDSLKLAAMGYSFFMPSLGLGLTQRDLLSIKELENDVNELETVLIPLQSAYTSGSNESPTGNSVGRPKKAAEDKSPKTIANEDSLDRQGGSN